MQKKAARRGQRALAFLLCLLMVATLLPVMGASAAEGDVSATGVELNKTLTLQNDGTYAITLEAYATGTVTSTQVTEPVPTDFVLVLDQSGSMANNIKSYTYTAHSQAYSYSSFYYSYSTYYYKDGDAYYEVQSDYAYSRGTYTYCLYYTKDNVTYYLSGSEVTTTRPTNVTDYNATIWTGVLYTRTESSQTKLAALKTAVTNFVTSVQNQKYTNGTPVDHRIAIVGFASGGDKDQYNKNKYENTELFVGSNTYTYGGTGISSQYANALQKVSTPQGRTNLTNSIAELDSYGGTYPQYGFMMANEVLDKRTVKTYQKADKTTANRGTVVVMFTDGEPGTGGTVNTGVANATMQQAKTSKNTYGAKVFTIGVFSLDNRNLSDINKYMNAVSSNYQPTGNQTPTMNNPGTAKPASDQTNYYAMATDSKALNDAFQSVPSSVNSSSTSCELDADSVLKDVISENLDLPEGFNAAENVFVKTADYKGGAKAAESITFTDFDDKNAAPLNNAKVDVSGKTVKVSNFDYKSNYVTGVANKDGTFSGKKLIVTITGLIPNQAGDGQFSNEDTSGIYHNGELRAAFERPSFSVASRNVVIDFGMTANIAENVGNKNTREGVQDENGGTFTYGDDNTLTFKPTVEKDKNGNYTLPFTGVSSALYYGVDYAAVDSPNAWTWVNVIPANNVYYDDTYLNTQDGTGSSDFTDGNYGYESAVENAENNTTAIAKGTFKTFTFTGTGIDVYCTTESTSGSVFAQLRKVNKDGSLSVVSGVSDISMNDTYQSGTLYNVPTISFRDLDYGAYQLKIYTDKTVDYQLDGVRVYNPANENDKIVKDAYANDNEQNATFLKVRDLLIEAKSFNGGETSIIGAVYTDDIHDNATIADYKDIGPKNEVYLANGDAIAFKVDGYQDGKTVMVGLSAPAEGSNAGEVTMSNGSDKAETPVNSAVDMYYKVTPTAKGYVVIENTGSSLISVTNVKLSGTANANGAGTLSVDEGLLTYMASFNTLNVVQPEPEPTPDPEPAVSNNTVSAIIRAIWAQVMDSIGRLFGR